MADDLFKLWGNLSLTEDEDLELSFGHGDLNKGETYVQFCVLGKLMADRLVSKETIRTSMQHWWRLEGSIAFKVLGDNLFLIEFVDPKDKERVLDGRPWVFEGGLFLVEDFDGTKAPSLFSFEKAAFWVRMIDLPLACMCGDIDRKIGASVGTVVEVDTDARDMGWGEYLRVKILLDLAKPLQRGRRINIEGKSYWVSFQYERLPKFCFLCGAICHGKLGCPKRSSLRQQQETNQYGLWLRAPSPTRRVERNQSRPPMKKTHYNTASTKVERKVYTEMRSGRLAGEKRGRRYDDGEYTTNSDGGTGQDGDGTGCMETATNPNSQNGKSKNIGENQGETSGFIFGSNPFVREDANKKGNATPAGDKIRRNISRHLNSNSNDKTAKKGKMTAANGLHGYGPKIDEDCKDKNNTNKKGSPAVTPRFSGPLFSDVEKTLQGENRGLKDREFIGDGEVYRKTASWKRKACSEIWPLEPIHKEQGKKQRESPEEEIGAAAGNVVSDNETIGSGLAEAVVQPRPPQ
jgi:hypothetical protein